MRWRNRRMSGNVEDRRGMTGRGLAVGGGIGSIILVLIALLFGADPRALLQQGTYESMPPSQGVTETGNVEEDELARFVSVVLAETETVWSELFAREGQRYREPTLVLFTGQVSSACGYAGAAVGPFYCSSDEKLYIDLSFYEELRARFGAPGDFAQAYVIAHEVGHHIQNLAGTMQEIDRMRRGLSQEEANELSVRLELQADFYAGVWAYHAEQAGILEPGDIEEALDAASAIGDDRLQMEAQGRIVPDSFTHGTSAQRSRWFRLGYETGDPDAGDTFRTPEL